MFLGHPLKEWFALFEAIEMFSVIIMVVFIVDLHNEGKPLNKNRFTR